MKRSVRTLGIFGRFAISLVAVVVVQGILAHKFRVFGYFDLPLVCAVYYGFTLGNPVASILVGSSLGLMQDSLSGMPLGANGFSKAFISFLAATAGVKIDLDQVITRVLGLFLFTLGDGLLVTMLSVMAGAAPNLAWGGVLGRWLLSSVFNTLLGLALLGYHDRWRNATA